MSALDYRKINDEQYRKPITKYDKFGDYVIHRNNIANQHEFTGNQLYDSLRNNYSVMVTKQDKQNAGIYQMQRDIYNNRNNYSEKPNNIFYKNANYLLNKQPAAGESLVSKNDDYDSVLARKYEEQANFGSKSAIFTSSPRNMVPGNAQGFYQHNEGGDQRIFTDRDIQQRYDNQSQYLNLMRSQNDNLPNKDPFLNNSHYRSKTDQMKNPYRKLEVADKVTDKPQNLRELYKSETYRVPTYENMNIRSVANHCLRDRYYPDQIDFGRQRRKHGDNPLEEQQGRVRQSYLQDIFGKVSQRSPNKREQNQLRIMEKDARKLAVAHSIDIDHMKNMSHKLHDFKLQLQNMKNPKRAASFKACIERRIESQMSNDRKIKLTNLLLEERSQ